MHHQEKLRGRKGSLGENLGVLAVGSSKVTTRVGGLSFCRSEEVKGWISQDRVRRFSIGL